MTTPIVLKKVRKSYGAVTVVDEVDLNLEAGEFTVLVGPSGCGKSTMLRMIAGLETITSGELFIGGELANDLPAAKRGIAMVFQSYALYPHMTVAQNLSFGIEKSGLSRNEIGQRVQHAAETLKIQHLLGRKPRQLSGGQRQRVAIGRAITRKPEIFLFDEPLSNLDAELRVQMRLELSKLHKELGNTMIYVTHDQVEAMTMADRIVVLNAGNVEQMGTPLEIYNSPKNPFVASFFGSPKMNIWEASDAAFRHLLGGGGEDVAHIGIRPEHVLTDGEGEVFGTGNVSIVEQLGGQTAVYATLESGLPVTALLPGQHLIAPGTSLTFKAQPGKVHFFARRE